MAKAAKKKKPAKKAPAKKKPAKKQLARKQRAKKQRANKQLPRPMAARALMPRREDVPGIAKDLPDFANFREAAIALKVAPFFTGPGAVPFSRLRATQILDPMRGQKSFNDFFLA
jgi:hypothetical protein